jgi:hypothetical protein
MAYTLKQFDTAQEMVDYLNNVVQGKSVSSKIYGLHGLTLIVTPVGDARTVTFADADNEGLSLGEIIAQMEDVNADMVGVAAFRSYRATIPSAYRLTFTQAGDVVDKDGTANSIFGFDTTGDSTVGANAVALADIAAITTDEGGNKFTVVHQ